MCGCSTAVPSHDDTANVVALGRSQAPSTYFSSGTPIHSVVFFGTSLSSPYVLNATPRRPGPIKARRLISHLRSRYSFSTHGRRVASWPWPRHGHVQTVWVASRAFYFTGYFFPSCFFRWTLPSHSLPLVRPALVGRERWSLAGIPKALLVHMGMKRGLARVRISKGNPPVGSRAIRNSWP